MDDPVPRTTDDLYAIARFIRARVREEHQTAGGLAYYLKQGMTISASIPAGNLPDPDIAQEFTDDWLRKHNADAFLAMASVLASMADELASILRLDADKPGGRFRVEMAWPELVRAARLWRDHPEFQDGWEQGERDANSG
ncbi:hypothetical protein ABZX39_33630 [Streptomyces collinus]|uniref:hypothetical protein n=1 Tax=Streptomyces collinus TaxID=42684 RepID=UPI0033B84E2A